MKFGIEPLIFVGCGEVIRDLDGMMPCSVLPKEKKKKKKTVMVTEWKTKKSNKNKNKEKQRNHQQPTGDGNEEENDNAELSDFYRDQMEKIKQMKRSHRLHKIQQDSSKSSLGLSSVSTASSSSVSSRKLPSLPSISEEHNRTSQDKYAVPSLTKRSKTKTTSSSSGKKKTKKASRSQQNCPPSPKNRMTGKTKAGKTTASTHNITSKLSDENQDDAGNIECELLYIANPFVYREGDDNERAAPPLEETDDDDDSHSSEKVPKSLEESTYKAGSVDLACDETREALSYEHFLEGINEQNGVEDLVLVEHHDMGNEICPSSPFQDDIVDKIVNEANGGDDDSILSTNLQEASLDVTNDSIINHATGTFRCEVLNESREGPDESAPSHDASKRRLIQEVIDLVDVSGSFLCEKREDGEDNDLFLPELYEDERNSPETLANTNVMSQENTNARKQNNPVFGLFIAACRMKGLEDNEIMDKCLNSLDRKKTAPPGQLQHTSPVEEHSPNCSSDPDNCNVQIIDLSSWQ